MNNRFKNSLLAILLLASLPAWAQNDAPKEKKRLEHFKERNISKTYPAAGNSLSIDNSFGDVVITTGGSEIKVDIHIEASSDNQALAEQIFNNIDVTDSKNGNTIDFKTNSNKDGKGNNINCHKCSSTMTINYNVQLPAGTPLTIVNNFGAIRMPDYTGNVNLTSKFGSLTTGSLSSTGEINVEFGKADIKSSGDAKYVFKFSTINIGSLTGSNTISMEFCDASKLNLAAGLSSLILKESYSTVNIKPITGLSASYDIKTSFGSFKNKMGTDIKRTDEPDRYGPDSDRHYEGKSGSGSSKVEIRSSFGTIILGDATEAELQSGNKGKSKSSSTRVI